MEDYYNPIIFIYLVNFVFFVLNPPRDSRMIIDLSINQSTRIRYIRQSCERTDMHKRLAPTYRTPPFYYVAISFRRLKTSVIEISFLAGL